ncbi:hypothetical protein ACFWY5_46645 [Nonomuraea sp. NPDC059007]|uniref:hypothetical protein n=1 Tax=Nonomuraea sp. NPDC059007 TaxID=3346692 RepID=UPI0036BF873F
MARTPASNSGRKPVVRSEYAELQQFCEWLWQQIYDVGLTLRTLEPLMNRGKDSIRVRINGSQRPTWDFVEELISHLSGKDKNKQRILLAKARDLWEKSDPRTAAPMAELETSARRMDTYRAQAQCEIERHQQVIYALMYLLGAINSQAKRLCGEHTRIQQQLADEQGKREAAESRLAQLQDIQTRLDAAQAIGQETEAKLEEARRQKLLAEELRDTATRRQQEIQPRTDDEAFAAESVPEETGHLFMGRDDQQAAEQYLAAVGAQLDDGAEHLHDLQSALYESDSAATTSDNPQPDSVNWLQVREADRRVGRRTLLPAKGESSPRSVIGHWQDIVVVPEPEEGPSGSPDRRKQILVAWDDVEREVQHAADLMGINTRRQSRLHWHRSLRRIRAVARDPRWSAISQRISSLDIRRKRYACRSANSPDEEELHAYTDEVLDVCAQLRALATSHSEAVAKRMGRRGRSLSVIARRGACCTTIVAAIAVVGLIPTSAKLYPRHDELPAKPAPRRACIKDDCPKGMAEEFPPVWRLAPKASTTTEFALHPADFSFSAPARLIGALKITDACPGARVAWRITVDRVPVVMGTLDDHRREQPLWHPIGVLNSGTTVSVVAGREDGRPCTATMSWEAAGVTNIPSTEVLLRKIGWVAG